MLTRNEIMEVLTAKRGAKLRESLGRKSCPRMYKTVDRHAQIPQPSRGVGLAEDRRPAEKVPEASEETDNECTVLEVGRK